MKPFSPGGWEELAAFLTALGVGSLLFALVGPMVNP